MSFWDAVDAELAGLPMAPELEPLPRHSSTTYTTYLLKLTSLGPYRISAYFSVPSAVEGSAPALLQTPRYGSVNHIPDAHDRDRYVVLQLMHRGQRLADQPFAAEYPGLLTLGIDDPERYIYRGIVADCLRAAEFLLDQPIVDRNRVAVWGDDLALLTAARRPGFRAAIAADLLLYRLLEAAGHSEAYPVEELNDYFRQYPDRRDPVAATLRLFDPVAHATAIRSRTLLPNGDTPWLQPLRDALGPRCESYAATRQGRVDQDYLDAWLAAELGAQPRSRFVGSLSPPGERPGEARVRGGTI